MDLGLFILSVIAGPLLVGHGTQGVFDWLGAGGLGARAVPGAGTTAGDATRLRWAVPMLLCAGDAVALAAALLLTGTATSLLGLAYLAAAVATMAASDGYRSHITASALQSAPWLVGRLAIPLLLVAPAALLTGAEQSVFVLALAAIALVIPMRALSYALVRRARRSGHLLDGAVIVGAGEVGRELARMLQAHPEHGVHPVGFLDGGDDELPLPLLGDVDDLGALLERDDIHRVIVAFGPSREADLVDVLRTTVRHDVELHVVPRFFDVGGVAPAGPDNDDVRGIPLRRISQRSKARGLKRVLDVVVAGALLLVWAPLLAGVAALVRRSSPGPVFFTQDRVGRGGRVFKMRKFRTMYEGADADLDRLRHRNERDGAVFKLRDDPRCTPIGRWLRRFSIDELPQLWHVLTGDMTLVGPRPAVPSEVDRYDHDARQRLLVKPGLTGLWQVSGRSDLGWSESLRLDLYYIHHWAPSLDLAILGRTVSAVLSRQGAY